MMACDITMCISVVEATYSRRKGSRREHLNSSLLLLSVVDVIRRITGYLLSSTLCHSRTSLSDLHYAFHGGRAYRNISIGIAFHSSTF
ncbi:hypothetical protein CDAR_538341 [Caerostris darwini]|uniref:Uncharacterized protein n=1 Tax=Caerostris darwini TaxID=1538125 RepID=A0AAV4UCE1_9ARAC|nr:hypothetical protein CDAR_538341 [Caerostris darwini]